jgi:predicted permease
MRSVRIFEALLWCFPGPFRREYGEEMARAFSQEMRTARQRGSRREQAAIWLRSTLGIIRTAPQEHWHVIKQDVRYAVRTLAAQPGFTTVAVLSLALGIGANVAIFSVVNSLLLGALPVAKPGELMMLTDPGGRGTWTGSSPGERSLMTHAEFEQLRDETGVFSHLMASQSSVSRVQVRVNGAEPEEIQSRMVTAGYFDTLGVPALIGRTFGPADGAKPAVAVISHAFWERRLGGRKDALGTRIALRQTVITVIGIMPPPFFGETVGDRPDAWLPIALQPEILPGRDLLRDDPSRLQKTFWLHVFGRLKPGVGMARAETVSNAVFQRGLAAYYADSPSEEVRRKFLDTRLRVRSAATGASIVRSQFGGPLMLMLAAAGLVFLIACANLGNLMQARAASRTREIAVRQALGAGRRDLVRQWMTEGMTIAVAGGIAGLAAAWVLRAGLLTLVPNTIQLSESADWRVLAFAFALPVLAGALLGLLPSLRTLKIDAAAGMKEQSRGLTASAGWLRTGRWIVAGQVALSLPLLAGAGLLARTLDNLRRVDVGFSTEKLLMLRVDVESAGYEEPRRQALFERLLDRVRQVSGVRAASYSPHGVFLGNDSGDQVAVGGYTPRGDGDNSSRYDHVGPDYFSTLGVPIRLGRPITERDHAGSTKVCVINEAFAKKFFAGRNPIGLHVTQLFGHQRNRFQVVGVAADFRKANLRGEIEHRYFVPVAQPIDVPERVTFIVRTAGDSAAPMPELRRAILAEDPNLPIVAARQVTELMEQRLTQDQLLARLSLAFAATGLLLAAIGLYGVLAYGVARRTNEIGIRKALGARDVAVMAMILRESSLLVGSGLAAGLFLAFASLRWIESRLFGLKPGDPAVFGAAMLVLAAVGLAASWIPARRASQVDPLVAIRHE